VNEVVTPLADLAVPVEEALAPAAQERAFGPTGLPGDPSAIVSLAGELVDSYALFRSHEWAVRALDVRPHSGPIVALREATARLASEPAQQIRAFIRTLASELTHVPSQSEQQEPLVLHMTLKLDLPPTALKEYTQALAEVARTHRSGPLF
jgi:hypothetical protein